MADAVHALGDTVDELYANLKEILTRAKLSGFTFKPSKLIICPKKPHFLARLWMELNGHQIHMS